MNCLIMAYSILSHRGLFFLFIFTSYYGRLESRPKTEILMKFHFVIENKGNILCKVTAQYF